MDNRLSPIFALGAFLFGFLALSGLTWVNYRFTSQNTASDHFMPAWQGTRQFLIEGQSPYSQETTLAIQRLAYGRAARPGEDPLLFVYPFYSFLVFAPLAVIGDYVLARAIWMTVLELALFGLAAVGLNLSRWRISTPLMVMVLIFSVLWYHTVRPIINSDMSVLVGLYIALAFLAVRTDHDALAGFLFAIATIKPQMVLFLILFVLLWAASKQRWILFWSLISSLFFLVMSTSLFFPDWLLQNVRNIVSFRANMLPSTPGAIFYSWLPGVGNQMGWVLTVFVIGTLLWEWRAARGRDFRWFYWTGCLTLALTNLAGIQTSTENYIALLPGLILVLAVWDERWGQTGRTLVITSIFLMLIALWGLFFLTVEPGTAPYQNPVMFFPAPFFMVIGLYWVRWWAIRPPPPLLDQLRNTQNGAVI